MSDGAVSKWYDNKVVVWLLLFFFFPVGLYALYKSRSFSGKGKVMISSAMAVLIVLGMAIDDPPTSKQGGSVVHEASAPLPPFTIISDDSMGRVKRSVEVLLSSRISERELESLALHIKKAGKGTFERTFIGYRLSGQAGGMYWATTHFDPVLKVSIIGDTNEEFQKLVSDYSGPEQFSSIAEMIESFGDYGVSENTFSMNGEGNSFRLSPMVFSGDHPDVIYHITLRAMVYGVYNSFIHTDARAVDIEVKPLMVDNLKRDNPRFVDRASVRIATSREQALRAAQRVFSVDSLSALKVPTRYGDGWLDSFDTVYESSDRIHDLELLVALLRVGQ